MVDLARGHVKAIEKIRQNPGTEIYNLGTGMGYSVLDIVKNFEEASGVKIPYVIKERRAGDIAAHAVMLFLASCLAVYLFKQGFHFLFSVCFIRR